MLPPRAATGLSCIVALLGLASSSPAPRPNPVAESHPEITPFQVQYVPTKTLHARADILSKLEGGVNSVLSKVGSAVPSYVASGLSAHQCLIWASSNTLRHSQLLPRLPN